MIKNQSTMDTKFWGPSAWKLLHMAAFQYNPTTQHNDMASFLSLLPFVLPCKFCRKSLTEYYGELPFEGHLGSQKDLALWLYKIHNKVNGKLKSQGLLDEPNPSFREVSEKYKNYLSQGCSKTIFPGWEFLFSILDNHPFSKEGRHTKPFECSPFTPPPTTNSEKNRFNTLTPEERVPYLIEFFQVLPRILPYREWQEVWDVVAASGGQSQTCNNIGEGRRRAISWLWKIRKELEAHFELENKDTFLGLCSTVATHRSGCSKSSRAITCRRSRKARTQGGHRSNTK